jgi:outer membrane protein assembly factor BamD (BamD/ComL family)
LGSGGRHCRLALAALLIAGAALGQDKPAERETGNAAGATPSSELRAPSSAARPEWLDASGAPASGERASPQAALAWAELLAAESSYSAASRAYEALLRRWPAAPQAREALLGAARAALAAGEYDRAEALAGELRNRWPLGQDAPDREMLSLVIAEARLAGPGGAEPAGKAGEYQAKQALKAFSDILEREKAGPCAERAALGRARTHLALGSRSRAIGAYEDFLKVFPNSELVPTARAELASASSARARGQGNERAALDDARESTAWAEGQAKAGEGRGEAAEAEAAIRETYRAIAARQAELKMEEARLYLKLRKTEAAETVLRSVLGRYGDTPSAQAAAKLLEKLAQE